MSISRYLKLSIASRISYFWKFLLNPVTISLLLKVDVGGGARVQYCKLVCQQGAWKGPYCSHDPSHDITFSPGNVDMVTMWQRVQISRLRLQIGDILGIASVLFRSDQFRFSQLSSEIFPATPSSSELCICFVYFIKRLIGNVLKWNFIHCIESFKVKIISCLCFSKAISNDSVSYPWQYSLPPPHHQN